MYQVGDWVVEKNTGRIGTVAKKHWSEVAVHFGKAVALRYHDQIELAPLDIQAEDLLAMQHLAVDINDKQWFVELGERLNCDVKQIRRNGK
jgi:hypothetical protein